MQADSTRPKEWLEIEKVRPIGFIGKDILALEKKMIDPGEIISRTRGLKSPGYRISSGNKSSTLPLIGKKTERKQRLGRNDDRGRCRVVLCCAKP